VNVFSYAVLAIPVRNEPRRKGNKRKKEFNGVRLTKENSSGRRKDKFVPGSFTEDAIPERIARCFRRRRAETKSIEGEGRKEKRGGGRNVLQKSFP